MKIDRNAILKACEERPFRSDRTDSPPDAILLRSAPSRANFWVVAAVTLVYAAFNGALLIGLLLMGTNALAPRFVFVWMLAVGGLLISALLIRTVMRLRRLRRYAIEVTLTSGVMHVEIRERTWARGDEAGERLGLPIARVTLSKPNSIGRRWLFIDLEAGASLTLEVTGLEELPSAFAIGRRR